MKTIPLPSLLVAASLALPGCADMAALEAGGGATATQLQERGQTVLFVGADPITLETDLFLARALGEEGEPPPSLLQAAAVEVSPLQIAALGASQGLFPDEGGGLFSDALPYAVPDRDGARVGLITSGSAEDAERAPGRAAVLDIETRALTTTEDLPGLADLRFSSLGRFVFLSEHDAEGEPSTFQLRPADNLAVEWVAGSDIPGLPDTGVTQFAGSIAGTDEFLVLARPDGGNADVFRVDPDALTATNLSGSVDGNATAPSLAPSGDYLAVTVSRESDAIRQVVVIDLVEDTSEVVSDPNEADCSWPVWAPAASGSDRLAYVCQSLATQRPDLALWPPDLQTSANGYLTDRAQPAIVGGSMDGQVVRSRPQWDPTGSFLVFGASSSDDGDGELTLLILPLGSSVFPIYQAPQGSVGWVHFSALGDGSELMVWDRGTTGLQSSNGLHPIQVVTTDAPNPAPHGVDLGQDLLVTYPLFLGQNTMLYPE